MFTGVSGGTASKRYPVSPMRLGRRSLRLTSSLADRHCVPQRLAHTLYSHLTEIFRYFCVTFVTAGRKPWPEGCSPHYRICGLLIGDGR